MARIVLVADDSPTIQKRAMGLLKGDGYEVETVSNGVAALKRLAVIHPVVVLADVCMPGRDGYEVCEYVKKTPEFSHIPVVLITSDMEPYDSAKGTAVRADGILKKPFEGRELLALVDRLAEQCENAAPSVEDVSIAPTDALESSPVDEIELTPEAELTPTLITAPAPDFSAHSSGVAFAEPDEAPAFPQHAAVESFSFSPSATDTVHARENDFEFPTLHAEEPALSLAPSPVFDPEQEAAATPSFLEAFGAAPEHPVFHEESSAPQAKETSAGVRAATGHMPPELSDPARKETFAAVAHAAEAGAATGLEPQFISEDLDVSALGDHGHSHPHPHDHDHDSDHDHAHDEDSEDHPPAINPLNATNLGSFSLDAAAAGHVRFNADVPEVIYADESAEASALAEPAAEAALGKRAVPEVVYAEASSEEEALLAPVAEAAAPESELSKAVAEAAEPEDEGRPAPQVVYASTEDSVTEAPAVEAVEPVSIALVELEHSDAAAEPVAAESHEETAHEVALEPVESDEPKPYEKPEVSVIEPIRLEAAAEHEEFTTPEATKDTVDKVAAAVGTVIEPEPAEAVTDAPVASDLKADDALETAASSPEPVAAEPVVSTPKPAASEPAAAEAAPSATPESIAQTSAPSAKPALDSDMIYSIVHKVVGHMAPSFLGDEAKADMAKRLAEKIADEIKSESSPQA